jgi:hypothetical protein
MHSTRFTAATAKGVMVAFRRPWPVDSHQGAARRPDYRPGGSQHHQQLLTSSTSMRMRQGLDYCGAKPGLLQK